MTERPTDYDSLVAAVREEVDTLRAQAARVQQSPSYAACATYSADRLAALLPPAKERVPWWEAKGRTVDGREITEVSDGHRGSVWAPSVWAETSILGGRRFLADSDGMVGVDAL